MGFRRNLPFKDGLLPLILICLKIQLKDQVQNRGGVEVPFMGALPPVYFDDPAHSHPKHKRRREDRLQDSYRPRPRLAEVSAARGVVLRGFRFLYDVFAVALNGVDWKTELACPEPPKAD